MLQITKSAVGTPVGIAEKPISAAALFNQKAARWGGFLVSTAGP